MLLTIFLWALCLACAALFFWKISKNYRPEKQPLNGPKRYVLIDCGEEMVQAVQTTREFFADTKDESHLFVHLKDNLMMECRYRLDRTNCTDF